MEEVQELPWYRQFWPWFIMALPAASVVGGLFTFYLAGGEPSMVVDDYGRIAMATAQRAERTRRAEHLGLDARLVFATKADSDAPLMAEAITVTLQQQVETDQWPGALVLQLVHPTRSELDRTIQMPGSRGRYTGRVDRPPGRYYVSLSDAEETWRLIGELPAGAPVLELHAGSRAE